MLKKTFLLILLLMVVAGVWAQDLTVSGDVKLLDNNQGIIAVTYIIPPGQHMFKQEDYVYVDIEAVPGVTFAATIYPEGHQEEGNIAYYDQAVLTVPFSYTGALPASFSVTAAYQACNEEGQCFIPDEAIIELAVPAGANAPKEDTATGDKDKLASSDVLKFLMMAFLGGIILNIMPCVLPVLSIKAMHIVNSSQHNRSEIMKSSLAYTFGILISFLIMAIAVVVIKMTGESVGWGFQFQNAGFTISLAALIFVFSLSMFDVFIINPPGMSAASRASAKKGHWGSFMSGVFAVLLATPCTAPMLGPALGFAFRMPPVLIILFFLVIGLGLAIPFILLAFWQGAYKKIPKPGEWMNIFKEFMAFLLLGTTVFLLRTVHTLVGSGANFIQVLWFFLALGLAAWIYGRFARPHHSRIQQWLALFIAIAVVSVSAYTLLNFADTSSVSHNLEVGWEKFSEERLACLLADEQAVFIDFGAEWCMTCKANEATVLFTNEIKSAFDAKRVTLLKGDNTKKDPLISKWLKKFDRAGVPLYILYIPGQAEPITFPEIITKSMILDKLEEIK